MKVSATDTVCGRYQETVFMGTNVAIIDQGDFPKTEYPRYLLRQADYVICCDGALEKYLRNMEAVFGRERMPDIVIGDMDSLRPSVRKKYTGLIVREEEQEHNDQTKAVRYAVNNLPDISSIRILGGTGGREDHTIGNLSLLMEYTRMFENCPQIEMVSDHCTAFAVTDSMDIHCGEGRSFSLFSPDNSLKIKSTGLEWKNDEVVFDNWWKATLNRASEDTVHLEFSHKSIALVILD